MGLLLPQEVEQYIQAAEAELGPACGDPFALVHEIGIEQDPLTGCYNLVDRVDPYPGSPRLLLLTTPPESDNLKRLLEEPKDSASFISAPDLASHVGDLDIMSMYAFSPLVLKQSFINKVFKQRWNGKSHRAKINAKRRLHLYRGAMVEYDTEKHKDRTMKKISSFIYTTSPMVDMKISFDYKGYENDTRTSCNV